MSGARAVAMRSVMLGLLAVVGCRDARAPREPLGVDVLVIAPHPDDEVLIAGGVMQRAVARGERVAVVVVTNGDYTCARDGYARESETVEALARAGVAERDVHFLGYPDGHLASLGSEPYEVERRGPRGDCIRAATTYGVRGAGNKDAHTARAGVPAPYTSAALVDDLAELIARLAPHDLYVTHAIDGHPDHAATYAFVRRALERAPRAGSAVTLHRAVVHAGPCWPNGREPRAPCPPFAPELDRVMPPLPDPLGAYLPAERIPIDGAWKLAALERFASQSGGDVAHDWLGGFARSDEVFYPEVLLADPTARGELRRSPAPGVASGVGAPRGPWTESLPARRTREVEQRAPLRFTTRVEVADAAAVATIDVMRAGALGDGYRLRIDARGTRATLERGDERERRSLRSWSLPADAAGAPHAFSLRIDPRPDDGGVFEVTLRRDGALVGVAVDPRPLPGGDSLAVQVEGAARVEDVEAVGEPR